MNQTQANRNGAGQRWDCLLINKNQWLGHVHLGNETSYTVGIFMDNGNLHVGVHGKGAGMTQRPLKSAEVVKMFGVPVSDAGNLADFINVHVGDPLTNEQGKYTMRGTS